MKDAIAEIVGKTIKHVLVKGSDREPRSQVFLVFTDGSYYELYANEEIYGSGSLSYGGLEHARKYMGYNPIIFEV